MSKTILATDVSVLRILDEPDHCQVISSTYFPSGGKRIEKIPGSKVGETYKVTSNMVPYGYGMNWENVSIEKL